MGAADFRPHDLLWLTVADRFRPADEWPDWLDAEWFMRAPVVVRREAMADGRLPVGARGTTRSQRCKGYVQRRAVARCVTPEMLARSLRTLPLEPPLAALQALCRLAPLLDATGLAWGPTGGVGFQLATGLTVLRPDSDLDLLVRAPAPLDGGRREQLAALYGAAGCRVDIQVDTGHGAFALSEWLRSPARVLVKTGGGPLLCRDPWQGP
ncbi:malonate decarboxylase holo-ACP synthase [Oxalobacteraceae bacterium A2-2]